ncbi:hypothetical protein IMZ48_43270 [Candidatus Bathyarchaeota archaeon]|nr:hypothetical protein [Candidatus Bathyarchaeota archaeon]
MLSFSKVPPRPDAESAGQSFNLSAPGASEAPPFYSENPPPSSTPARVSQRPETRLHKFLGKTAAFRRGATYFTPLALNLTALFTAYRARTGIWKEINSGKGEIAAVPNLISASYVLLSPNHTAVFKAQGY